MSLVLVILAIILPVNNFLGFSRSLSFWMVATSRLSLWLLRELGMLLISSWILAFLN